ncbi:MAG: hypothetical protein AAGA54_36035, partial [Myxococcota bacterium]
MSRRALSLFLSLPLGLALSACGDDSSPGGGTADTDTDGGSTTDPTGDPTTGGPTTETPTTGDPTTGASSTTDPTVDPDSSSDGGETEDTSDTTGVEGGDTYFRINSLELRDPHAIFIGLDVTDSVVNDPLNVSLGSDEDGDGSLDLGFVMGLRPLDQTDGASETLFFANSLCTAPDGSSCDVIPKTETFEGMYTVVADGECYAADPANLSMYDQPPGAPEATTGPCFSSAIGSVTIAAGSFTLPLENATVAAQFVGDPAGNLVSGNIEGFVSQQTADMVMVD